MASKVAVFGGSFNPPGTHHRMVAEALVPHFDKIIVLPCGPRPDKEAATNDVDSWHRAALADIAFRGVPKVEVDLFDLELASFTANDQLQARYGHLGEVWHVIGSELSRGGGTGHSAIQRSWDRGAEMWCELNFCVVTRQGDELEADFPPKHMHVRLEQASSGASFDIREKIFMRLPYTGLVTPEVAAYIERYGLYRGRIPSRRTRWRVDPPRVLIVADQRNARAVALAETYRSCEDTENPTCILVLGGDGTMLHAIKQHWRRRVPFLGVNQGHLGFLLNEPEALLAQELPQTELIIRSMPMLFIESEGEDGAVRSELAFNDAWVERGTSQSAWVEVSVNGQVRIPKLVADGVLVCTAAGTTAYARSMGVAPLLADTPGWMIVGSNVMTPPGWKSALLSPEASVLLRSTGGEKRPVCAFVDGRPLGPAISFRARQSRIATVELVFATRHDMAEKIARIQFPAVEPTVL